MKNRFIIHFIVARPLLANQQQHVLCHANPISGDTFMGEAIPTGYILYRLIQHTFNWTDIEPTGIPATELALGYDDVKEGITRTYLWELDINDTFVWRDMSCEIAAWPTERQYWNGGITSDQEEDLDAGWDEHMLSEVHNDELDNTYATSPQHRQPAMHGNMPLAMTNTSAAQVSPHPRLFPDNSLPPSDNVNGFSTANYVEQPGSLPAADNVNRNGMDVNRNGMSVNRNPDNVNGNRMEVNGNGMSLNGNGLDVNRNWDNVDGNGGRLNGNPVEAEGLIHLGVRNTDNVNGASFQHSEAAMEDPNARFTAADATIDATLAQQPQQPQIVQSQFQGITGDVEEHEWQRRVARVVTSDRAWITDNDIEHIGRLIRKEVRSGTAVGYKRTRDIRWKKMFVFAEDGTLRYRSISRTTNEAVHLPVIRKQDAFQAIRDFHHRDTTHCGTKKSEAFCKSQVYGIPVMAMRTYVSMCGPCNAKLPQNETAPLMPIISTEENERWQMDLVDMRHESDGKFRWILHVKDHWDKFSWLFALTKKEAMQVANKIDFLFGCFGPPRILQSDNGTEFCAEVVVILAKKWGIKLINGRPRRPQTQGLVEQANGVVQARLTKWKLDNGSGNWTAGLPHMMASINQTLHEASRQIPFESRFSRAVQAQLGVAIGGEALQELSGGTFALIEGLRELPVSDSDNENDMDSVKEVVI